MTYRTILLVVFSKWIITALAVLLNPAVKAVNSIEYFAVQNNTSLVVYSLRALIVKF
ncbi:MAG: hypothetical protein ACJAYG_001734 [Oceanicoccus sp.]|jgi:hypothetical protein